MTAEAGHAPNRVYYDQQGNLHQNGAVLYDSAETALAGSFNDLNASADQPAACTITPAAGSANVSLVTIQINDADGVAVTAPTVLIVSLSDAASGAGLTGTTASGTVAAGAKGTDLSALVSKKALLVQTDAAGTYILSITDTAKTGFYIAAQIPGLKNNVSAQLVAGNYG